MLQPTSRPTGDGGVSLNFQGGRQKFQIGALGPRFDGHWTDLLSACSACMPGKVTRLVQEISGFAGFDDAALLEHKNSFGLADGGETVGNDEDGRFRQIVRMLF